MLFENSKQKLNSNQTTQIIKMININKNLGTKTCKKNVKNHQVKQDFVHQIMQQNNENKYSPCPLPNTHSLSKHTQEQETFIRSSLNALWDH